MSPDYFFSQGQKQLQAALQLSRLGTLKGHPSMLTHGKRHKCHLPLAARHSSECPRLQPSPKAVTSLQKQEAKKTQQPASHSAELLGKRLPPRLQQQAVKEGLEKAFNPPQELRLGEPHQVPLLLPYWSYLSRTVRTEKLLSQLLSLI